MLLMFFLYFAVAYAIEYVGLGLRYLMARTLGYFVVEHSTGEAHSAAEASMTKTAQREERRAKYGRQ